MGSKLMTIPTWVEDAVFYQIFPDRFANGDKANDPPNLRAWNAPPTVNGFQGGDLQGIIQKFDYLLDLGSTAIYLNPIFQSASTHHYNTCDYFQIDPKLGTLRDFHSLIDLAHRSQIKIILDGVFNHCGRGFFAFNDVLENQDQSAYKDWFFINRFPIDAYSGGDATDYQGWWKLKSLPKLRTETPAVRKYIYSIAKYWIEQGADGWRLDVPNEIDDDDFWWEFRNEVKRANPDAYLLGEIWEALPRWADETHFDGLMNYPLRESLIGFVNGSINASHFSDRLDRLFSIYPRENVYAMYNPLGSHDTERIKTILGGHWEKLQMIYALLFALPGAPAIYYGDEVGLEGGKDPDCRRSFPWEGQNFDGRMRSYSQRLITLRKRSAVLRRGDYRKAITDEIHNCHFFYRVLGGNAIMVAANGSTAKASVRVPTTQAGWRDGQIVHNLLGKEEFIVTGDELHFSLPPQSCYWLE
jgi:cyclomaltodextrinase